MTDDLIKRARDLAGMLGEVADATGPNAAADIARHGAATIRALADEVASPQARAALQEKPHDATI